MVFCSRCGTKNENFANYCYYCGSRIIRSGPDEFDKRISEFADEVGQVAEEFGKKAEVVAKNIYEDVRKTGKRISKKVEKKTREIREDLGLIDKVCKECNTKNEGTAKFCRNCGKKLK